MIFTLVRLVQFTTSHPLNDMSPWICRRGEMPYHHPISELKTQILCELIVGFRHRYHCTFILNYLDILKLPIFYKRYIYIIIPFAKDDVNWCTGYSTCKFLMELLYILVFRTWLENHPLFEGVA